MGFMLADNLMKRQGEFQWNNFLMHVNDQNSIIVLVLNSQSAAAAIEIFCLLRYFQNDVCPEKRVSFYL